jgi:putative ABC transport system permease protein
VVEGRGSGIRDKIKYHALTPGPRPLTTAKGGELMDLRYSFRMLLKSPGFTAVAVLSLALGIGANTSIFSLVNALLLRALPVSEPDRLVYLFNGSRNSPYSTSSYPDYVDYRDHNEVFSDLAAFSNISVSLASPDQTDLITGSIVSGDFFPMLGVGAQVGRTLLPDDDKTPGAHPVAVISHNLWQSRFGGEASVVGQQIALNGHSFTIVGVAQAGFDGAELLETNDIYVPMMMQAVVRPPRGGFSGEMNPDLLGRRGPRWMRLIGRLRPGVTIEQAQASVESIATQLGQTYPNTNQNTLATLYPVSKIDPRAYSQFLSVSFFLLAVVAVVLLIACANVANLLLARASARRKEVAIRLALGASRTRLVRQLLTESVMLALVGGLVGLLLAMWTIDILKSTPPPAGIFSFKLDFSLDGRVLLFTLALSIATGIIFGLAPALQTSRPDLVLALKDDSFVSSGGRRRFSLRSMLVVAQVALSLVLMICAGLFLRSLREAQGISPGFDADKVATASLGINLLRYTKPQGQDFYRRVIEQTESLAGVQSASLVRVLPISGGGRRNDLFIEGQATPDSATRSAGDSQDSQLTVSANVVGLKYFQTMGIGMLAGRDFNEQDREGAPGVAIVNETFARRHLGGEDPLGRRISLSGQNGPWLQIIGLVRDSKYRTLGETPTPFVYSPLGQTHETGMSLLVRTAGEPSAMLADIRSTVQSLDRNLPVTDVRPLEELLASALFPARMGAVLITVVGGLALLLASVGLYGVMSYSVARRTREIGIRMALGAQTTNVLVLVLREGMMLVVAGLGIGLAVAFAVTRLLASFLYGISATDPVTFAAITIVLAGVALGASFIPARRAAKVDPMVALRYE